MKARKGFTLVEIIVALVIISLSAAIILPNINVSSEVTKAQAAQNNLWAINAAQGKYFEDNIVGGVNVYCTTSTGNPSPCLTTLNDNANINSNLHLSIPSSDPFNYSCTAVATTPPTFNCTASDGTDTLSIATTTTGAANYTCSSSVNQSYCP